MISKKQLDDLGFERIGKEGKFRHTSYDLIVYINKHTKVSDLIHKIYSHALDNGFRQGKQAFKEEIQFLLGIKEE